MDKASADGLGFRLDKVSFSGAVGAVMALACIFTLLEVPVMRWALVAVGVGSCLASALRTLAVDSWPYRICGLKR